MSGRFLYCQNTDCNAYLGSLGGDSCGLCDWKAEPEAPEDEALPEYGETEFGYAIWNCTREGDKRLMTFLIAQFGNDHQAVVDLEALLARASAAPPENPRKPVAWTLNETLAKGETTCTGRLWFSNPHSAAWTALYT